MEHGFVSGPDEHGRVDARPGADTVTRTPRQGAGGRAGGGRSNAPEQPDLPFDADPPPVAPKPRRTAGETAIPKPRTTPKASGKASAAKAPGSPKPKPAPRTAASAKPKPAPRKAAASRGKAKADRAPPTGFGGWLWLLAIGQLLVTARMIDTLMKMSALIGGPIWQDHRGLVIADLSLYGAAFLLQLAVLAAMALRSRAFVPLFVTSAIAYFLIGRVEPLLAIAFLGMDPARLASRAVLIPMAIEFAIAFGWSTYVLKSRRVRNTFVR